MHFEDSVFLNLDKLNRKVSPVYSAYLSMEKSVSQGSTKAPNERRTP